MEDLSKINTPKPPAGAAAGIFEIYILLKLRSSAGLQRNQNMQYPLGRD